MQRRWTRTEYDRLVELGVFEGEPLDRIDDCRIITLVDRVVEVYRDPAPVPPARVTPIAFPSAAIAVSDLRP
jgi:hypothetical protein